jgi:hypothetical protein
MHLTRDFEKNELNQDRIGFRSEEMNERSRTYFFI